MEKLSLEKILAAIAVEEKVFNNMGIDPVDIQAEFYDAFDNFDVEPSDDLMDFVDMCYANLARNNGSYNYDELPFI